MIKIKFNSIIYQVLDPTNKKKINFKINSQNLSKIWKKSNLYSNSNISPNLNKKTIDIINNNPSFLAQIYCAITYWIDGETNLSSFSLVFQSD